MHKLSQILVLAASALGRWPPAAERRGDAAVDRLFRHTARPANADARGRQPEERRLPDLPHHDRRRQHASQPGGGAGLHRLPRRQCAGEGDRRWPRTMRAYQELIGARPTSCRASARPGTIRAAPTRSAATRCSTGRARSSSASSIPATTASRARPAAPATWTMIEAAERSLMATGAMFWGGASYNNGILPLQELHPRRGLYPRRRARHARECRSRSTRR